ncbi:Ig-like domain-containing protein [Caballeronia sp.]|uniref:Ig-like domain-containing protein n=1 Tax=Caballeronia sp. TaxID=1931223 RepID=UPI003C5C40F0
MSNTQIRSQSLADAAVNVPAAPVLLGLSQHTPDGIDVVAAGATTHDTSPVLAFVAIPGDTYTLYDNGTLIGTLIATSDNTGWALPTLANGVHNLSLTHSTPAGMSAASNYSFTVDATPFAPVIPSVVDATGLLAGNLVPGGISTDGHAAFKGTTGNETADLNVDPSAYFKQATGHVQGSTGGIDTLQLTGDHQVLDLTSLSGKTAAAKVSGIESIDLGGHSNSLKLSLTDVLNLAELDLFQKDGKHQMMVSGSNGDAVDLSNAHIAGVADGQWAQHSTAQVGGVTYNVYEHSGAHTELLVQQGVQIALHN